MKIYWTAVTEDCIDYEADVITCSFKNNSINIAFESIEGQVRVEGSITLEPVDGLQTIAGRWRSVVKTKEDAKHKNSVSEFIDSKVSGHLKGFDGKKIAFDGSWDFGPLSNANNCGYNIIIDAKL